MAYTLQTASAHLSKRHRKHAPSPCTHQRRNTHARRLNLILQLSQPIRNCRAQRSRKGDALQQCHVLLCILRDTLRCHCRRCTDCGGCAPRCADNANLLTQTNIQLLRAGGHGGRRRQLGGLPAQQRAGARAHASHHIGVLVRQQQALAQRREEGLCTRRAHARHGQRRQRVGEEAHHVAGEGGRAGGLTLAKGTQEGGQPGKGR